MNKSAANLIRTLLLAATVGLTSSCGAAARHNTAAVKSVHLTSPAFKNGRWMPQQYTIAGADISPPLAWGSVPRSTRSILIEMIDPDAPRPAPFTHWLIFNIPPTIGRLPAGIARRGHLRAPPGARQGTNSFGFIGYGGPAPPPGPAHHYHIQIYALDEVLPLPAGARATALHHAIRGHILARGTLIVRWGR